MNSSPHPSEPLAETPSADAVATADDHKRRAQRQLSVVVFVFVLIGAGCVLAATAGGQEAQPNPAGFDSVPIKPAYTDDKIVRRMVSEARSLASGSAANGQIVGFYFKTYIPAVLTNPEYLPRVSEAMETFYDVLEAAERNGTRLSGINRVVLEEMSKLAQGNYPPAARINALTVLSRLHSRPAPDFRSPPEPLINALPVLIDVYNNEQNSDGVRAAALHGIAKHVNLSFAKIDDNRKSDLTRAMNQLLDAQPPAGRSAKAHAYLQRFAVDVLNVLRSNDDPSLGVKLVSISTEPSQPDLIAFHSAARIGTMGAELKGKIAEPDRVLDRWSRRALLLMEREWKRLDRLQRDEVAASAPEPEKFLPDRLDSSSESGGSKKRGGGGGNSLAEAFKTGQTSSRNRAAEPAASNQPAGSLADRLRGAAGGDTGAPTRDLEGNAEAQPAEVLASRKRLNHALQQLFMGVTGSPSGEIPARATGGILASVADDAKPTVQEWVAQIRPIVDEINDQYLESLSDYKAMLERQIEQLQETLGEEPEAAANSAAAPVEAAAS